jgi:hypothetical protein
LPVIWNIDLGKEIKIKKRVFYSMKIIDILLNKYKEETTISERKLISINHFISDLIGKKLNLKDI